MAGWYWDISPYPIDPHAIVRELQGASRIHGDVTTQRVAGNDDRFILWFAVEGDWMYVLRAGPW